MKNPLVTILTPVYNGESYIQRFIDSVLRQTYDNIFLIIVNDGSTDNTEKIIKKNKEAIKKRFKFKYIYQKNKGQAEAINNGLKYVKGDYFTWPDSDDILTNDSIEMKVQFLEKNKEYGFFRTNYQVVLEESINKIEYEIKPKNNNTNIFDDLILEKTYCTNGAYMVRLKDFLQVNPKKEIYISKGGQNWQLILPIAYSYKCGYIDKCSYKYIVRKTSHSRIDLGKFEKEIERQKVLKDILINTISTIDLDQKKYLKMINNKYLRWEMVIGKNYRKKDFTRKRYNQLKKSNELKISDKIYYIFGKNRITDKLISYIDD